MNRNIKLTISYDGTNFKGWQIQGKGERTVQDELTRSISKLLSEKITVIGSGRTDAGVHADGQVANFKTKAKLSVEQIQKALNSGFLPDDIFITEIKEVKETFNAQKSAKRKTYRYTIFNQPLRNPKTRLYSLHYPNKLNVRRMNDEAQSLVGQKDFKSFQAIDNSKPHRQENTVRKVYRCDVKKKKGLIEIEIEANGFLYKMVRNIVGTLLEVGSGKLEKGSIKNILAQKDRKHASPTAQPHGLSLVEVRY